MRRDETNARGGSTHGIGFALPKPFYLLIAIPLVLTGCSAVQASTGQITPTTTMPSGMVMAPGQTMPTTPSTTATPSTATIVNSSTPSKSSQMICGSETRANVATLMGLSMPPKPTSTWANNIYTCTYQLPVGPLVLSVKESAGVATARKYFDAMRERSGRTRALTGLAGLGLPAYENSTGTVVFLKDNMTLQVNASTLPQRVGPQGSSPADLAYTIATDVLACWTNK